MDAELEQYFEQLDRDQRRIYLDLHKLALDTLPELSVSIKRSQPVYELRDRICYLHAHSNYVNFGFWRGAELSAPDSLLEGSGKAMRHVKVRREGSLPEEGQRQLQQPAAELDRAGTS